ncbi:MULTISPECIES: hypothetical protein [Shouchella]|uniref:Uncharacterized protein n=2 Tax=Shouchella TaxID=2893057 RepID=A0ABY7W5E5_9BACI|nr:MULTISPECIES: hypothetical protein [Shouchella]MED4130250.1 hypothetical protein [Shouchella miscanthi]WDF02683.1 hypothetical protein PQ477_14305 [Shouchella hunanensis]GAF22494.1 hypothetical protein JCM19047_2248 [Bacillus sp. JCM 19047]
MEINVDRKRSVEEIGNFVCTEKEKLFVLVLDKGDKYPYLLLSLQTFHIIQNYDSMPTREELEEDIGEKIKEIYSQNYASITLH